MSAPRFYLDADFTKPAIARAVRAFGIDIETAVEAGLRTVEDDLQIAHVLATGRVLITGDNLLRDRLVQLTQQGSHHPGVLFLPSRRRREFGAIIFSLRLIHAVYSAEELVDQVIYIPL